MPKDFVLFQLRRVGSVYLCELSGRGEPLLFDRGEVRVAWHENYCG